jgi:hypothetical protein
MRGGRAGRRNPPCRCVILEARPGSNLKPLISLAKESKLTQPSSTTQLILPSSRRRRTRETPLRTY